LRREAIHTVNTKTVVYERSKILQLDRSGLKYVDDEGTACTIDFQICQDNVQKESQSKSGDIYVGFRDFSAKPPYVAFATDPETYFQFPMPKPAVAVAGEKFLPSDPGDFRDFDEFKIQLAQAGVRTIDVG
jgi:hypothetical protein